MPSGSPPACLGSGTTACAAGPGELGGVGRRRQDADGQAAVIARATPPGSMFSIYAFDTSFRGCPRRTQRDTKGEGEATGYFGEANPRNKLRGRSGKPLTRHCSVASLTGIPSLSFLYFLPLVFLRALRGQSLLFFAQFVGDALEVVADFFAVLGGHGGVGLARGPQPAGGAGARRLARPERVAGAAGRGAGVLRPPPALCGRLVREGRWP